MTRPRKHPPRNTLSGIDLEDAIRIAKEVGCEIEHVRRTGEMRMRHPLMVRCITFNGRRKDAPRRLTQRLSALQWRVQNGITERPHTNGVKHPDPILEPVITEPQVPDILGQIDATAADTSTIVENQTLFLEWASGFEDRLSAIEKRLTALVTGLTALGKEEVGSGNCIANSA